MSIIMLGISSLRIWSRAHLKLNLPDCTWNMSLTRGYLSMLTTVMSLISMMKIDSLGEDEFLSSWSSEWVRVGVRGWRNTWRPSPPNSLSYPPLAPWHAQNPKSTSPNPEIRKRQQRNPLHPHRREQLALGDVARSCLPTLVRGGHLGFATTSATPHWHNNAGKSNFVFNSKFEDISIN